MSRRLCFALDLVNDPAKIAEYERFHAPGGVWPEIVDDIAAQGIEGMEIWRTGDRMVTGQLVDGPALCTNDCGKLAGH